MENVDINITNKSSNNNNNKGLRVRSNPEDVSKAAEQTSASLGVAGIAPSPTLRRTFMQICRQGRASKTRKSWTSGRTTPMLGLYIYIIYIYIEIYMFIYFMNMHTSVYTYIRVYTYVIYVCLIFWRFLRHDDVPGILVKILAHACVVERCFVLCPGLPSCYFSTVASLRCSAGLSILKSSYLPREDTVEATPTCSKQIRVTAVSNHPYRL